MEPQSARAPGAASTFKACTPDADARTILADQQRDIGAALPHLPL